MTPCDGLVLHRRAYVCVFVCCLNGSRPATVSVSSISVFCACFELHDWLSCWGRDTRSAFYYGLSSSRSRSVYRRANAVCFIDQRADGKTQLTKSSSWLASPASHRCYFFIFILSVPLETNISECTQPIFIKCSRWAQIWIGMINPTLFSRLLKGPGAVLAIFIWVGQSKGYANFG